MDTTDFRLSVEEVAFILSLIGEPRLSRDVLVAQLKNVGQEQARERLMAAGHSLLARGWLTMGDDGTMALTEPLARVARVFASADFSIRYSRATREAEYLLTYHFSQGSIFEHRMEMGVVHHITEVADTGGVLQGGLTFLGVAEARPFSCPPVVLSNTVLDEVKDGQDTAAIRRVLAENDVPAEVQDMLTEDLRHALFRGSILRVEYGKNRAPVADRGLLVLRGPQRLWLLRPVGGRGKPRVTTLAGTEETFRKEVAALFQ